MTEQTLHTCTISKKDEMYMATVDPGTSLYISLKSPFKEKTVQEMLSWNFFM